LSIRCCHVERLAAGERKLVSEGILDNCGFAFSVQLQDVRYRQSTVLLEYVAVALLLCSGRVTCAGIRRLSIHCCSVGGPAQVDRIHKRVDNGEVSDFECGRYDGGSESAAFGDAFLAVQGTAGLATTEKILAVDQVRAWNTKERVGKGYDEREKTANIKNGRQLTLMARQRDGMRVTEPTSWMLSTSSTLRLHCANSS
jgi:hypothetical protein